MKTAGAFDANTTQRRRNRNKNLKIREPRQKRCERKTLPSLIESMPQQTMVLTWLSVRDFGSRNRKSVCTIRMSLEFGNLIAMVVLVCQAKAGTAC